MQIADIKKKLRVLSEFKKKKKERNPEIILEKSLYIIFKTNKPIFQVLILYQSVKSCKIKYVFYILNWNKTFCLPNQEL